MIAPRHFYDAVCDLKYNGVKVYDYLKSTLDYLLFYVDCPEKIGECSLFKGKYRGIPVCYDPENAAQGEIRSFLDSLEKRDVLFFTSEQFRKEANGRFYHTVLDPYILSLPEGMYSVIECAGEKKPMFYEDVHVWKYFPVWCVYGIEEIDFGDLLGFMQREFFSLCKSMLGLNLSEEVQHGITAFLFDRLCYRKAEYNFTLDILRRVKPEVVIYSHALNPCFMYLAEAARTLGIPAIEVTHGAFVPYPTHVSGIHDFIFLQSEINAAGARENGYNKVLRIGKPGFGITKARRLGAENGPAIVLFVSSCEYGLLEMAVKVSNMLDPEKYMVIYRIHSGEKHTVETLRDIQEKNKNILFSPSREPIEVALDDCDIVVGNRTTVLLEALRYKNVKVITCNLPDDPMPPDNLDAYVWKKVIESGELKLVSSAEELEREITSYKRDEFVRESEIYWDYDGDREFPAFVDCCAHKKDMLKLPAGAGASEAVMALYDVDAVSGIDDLVSPETDLSMEYAGIEATDGEEELMEYIENSPYEYITVIHPGALKKDGAEKHDSTLRKVALLTNNPYLDMTVGVAGGVEEVVKKLGAVNAEKYRNIVRVGLYPLSNILDLCGEERAVEGDLAECVFRKDAFIRICSIVGVHALLKQPAESMRAVYEKCRELALKVAYAEDAE